MTRVTPSSAELLLHPVRLRIVQAFLGDQQLTTADLRRLVGDASTATLYRQVATLASAGVLEVVGERQARGAVERTYRLRADRASVSAEDLAAMSRDDHRGAFTAFVAALLADFDRYLARDSIDLVRDAVGYRQVGVHATDDEAREMATAVREALRPWLDAGPGPGRTRRILTTVLLPAEAVPADGSDAGDGSGATNGSTAANDSDSAADPDGRDTRTATGSPAARPGA